MRKKERTSGRVIFILILLLICYFIISVFRQPLPEGTTVKINGKGYFSPLCFGDYSYQNWTGRQRREYCWDRGVLVEETLGVIEAGGDYETHYNNGAYRVVFTTTPGDQKILWFSVDDLEEVD